MNTQPNTDASENLLFTNHVGEAIDRFVTHAAPASVFVLTDTNTATFVLPTLRNMSEAVNNASLIKVDAGEASKSLDTLSRIWELLSDGGATRQSLLINVGGGVITDMGGFAAATFKRGIRFVNVPTTLLGAVDASVGGKNGINFNSLKNEIGTIRPADLVIVSTAFFRTLTPQELLSGYAEMLKHGFITSAEMSHRLMRYDITAYEPEALLHLLRENVAVKSRIVAQDLNDNGVRRALNFGHTEAHAFEALAMQRRSPLNHGYAVAFGMLVAMVLSRMKLDFPSEALHSYAAYVEEHYGAFAFSCADYDALLQFMHHDKKNATTGIINSTLLKDFGQPVINSSISDEDMKAALDIYRDLLHLP